MSDVNSIELERKYRVLRQTLGIHALLRDRYRRRSKFTECVMLVCSVIFCATTFVPESVFKVIGVEPEWGKLILGVASIAAFAASLILMLVDWKSKADLHSHAFGQWSSALAVFRDARRADGTWEPDQAEVLNRAYWEADSNSTSIPSGPAFTALKARYLLDVEVSRLKSEYVGCPRCILALVVRLTGTYAFLKNSLRKGEGLPNATPNNQSESEAGGPLLGG